MNVCRIPIALAGVIALVAACGGAPPPAPSIVAVSAPVVECGTTGARECQDASDCGVDLHCTGGRCFANHPGCPCSGEGDCGSNAHCARGNCYANKAGVPCSKTEECGPRAHCTAGDCYTNDTGSPCSEANECGPGSSCVSGRCN